MLDVTVCLLGQRGVLSLLCTSSGLAHVHGGQRGNGLSTPFCVGGDSLLHP